MPLNRSGFVGGVGACLAVVAAVVLASGVAGRGSGPGGVRAVGAASGGEDPEGLALEARYASEVEPILASHCFRCHGRERAKSGVRFEGLGSVSSFLSASGDLRRARDLIEHGEMPPEGEPVPGAAERATLVAWIDAVLGYTPPEELVDPGWFTIHRLNRAEYRYTMRDLLGVDPGEVDLAASLPPDDTGYGFDNIADVLTMSPLHVEVYLRAAERAVEVGLGPLVEVSEEARPVRSLEVTRPSSTSGSGYALHTNAEVFGHVDVPLTGDYAVVVEAWGTRGGDELPRLSVRVDGEEVEAFFVEAERGETDVFRVPVRLGEGRRRIGAAFTNDYWVPGVADRNLAIEAVSIAGPVREETLERPEGFRRVFFERPGSGAGEAESREVASRLVGRFAERAFRRPIDAEERRGLMGLYDSARRSGASFEASVRLALTGALVSPNFLYRWVDNPHAGDPSRVHRLSGHELASRLSYFLWSSMPDEELFELAELGLLDDPAVLRMQARRMLADPKAQAFVEHFAGQWLQLRNLAGLEIDPEAFPELTDGLRRDMRTEALLFFGDVVGADRPVTDLLAARDTFVNSRLASHYGLPTPEGADGETFIRVELGEDSPRGGVLTMAAVLAVTSNPTRTSPVKRGLYVLDQLLGAPPPPPPPNIPRLEQSASALPEDAPPRVKLAAHLTDPTCASCHRRMDPIGLALENFDAIGRWREAEHGRAIDASGELPGGVRFEGPEGLRGVLVDRREDFVEHLSARVLTYALGRGLEPFDGPSVRRIAREVSAREDRFGALVEAVVAGEAFRTCRAREGDEQR